MQRAKAPFFMVGMPRSGTTMLRELLNNSPDIWISSAEGHFIAYYARRIGRYRDLTDWRNFERLAATVRRSRAFAAWAARGVHIESREWYEACGGYEWPAILDALYRLVHQQELSGEGRAWADILWGDKTPVHLTMIPELATMFPEARFIHIVRDVRDCCLSAQRAWGRHPLRTAQQWAERVPAARKAGEMLGPERYCEVRYEDVLRDPCRELERLFGFLGVASPGTAGELFRGASSGGGAAGQRRVVAENAYKWKSAMPASLQRSVESIAGGALSERGYERVHPDVVPTHVTWPRMAFYRLRDFGCWWRYVRNRMGGWLKALKFVLAH